MPDRSGSRNALTACDLLFSLGLALLLTHEMDAMTHAEWRILPLLSWLPEGSGLFYFVVAHVPLFALILWFTASTSATIRWWAQAAVDSFLMIHVTLHTLFSGHPEYSFAGALSLVLIYGAGLFGFLHLLLLLITPSWAGAQQKRV